MPTNIVYSLKLNTKTAPTFSMAGYIAGGVGYKQYRAGLPLIGLHAFRADLILTSASHKDYIGQVRTVYTW